MDDWQKFGAWLGIPTAIVVAGYFLRAQLRAALVWLHRRIVPSEKHQDIAQALKALAELNVKGPAAWGSVKSIDFGKRKESHEPFRKAWAEYKRVDDEWERLTRLLEELKYPGVIPGRVDWEERNDATQRPAEPQPRSEW